MSQSPNRHTVCKAGDTGGDGGPMQKASWYGHVSHVTSCINLVLSMNVPSSEGRGRPKKKCVRADMRKCNLSDIDPQNIEA